VRTEVTAAEMPKPANFTMRRSAPPQSSARERLLVSAGEVFAAVGFRRATVREICGRAGANVAMVDYYFGGKERLYRAVLDRVLADAMRRAVPPPQTGGRAPAEGRLAACVSGLLAHALDNSVSGALIARETVEPTFGLDAVVDKSIRPHCEGIRSIVREVLGAQAGEDEVRWCEESIVAQCMHYRHGRPILDRLHPDQRYGPAEIKQLADHITRFSLGALRAIAARTQDGPLAPRPAPPGQAGPPPCTFSAASCAERSCDNSAGLGRRRSRGHPPARRVSNHALHQIGHCFTCFKGWRSRPPGAYNSAHFPARHGLSTVCRLASQEVPHAAAAIPGPPE
jgi:AcrR family transcriptional regulator